MSPDVVRRLQKLLRACWATFDGVAEAFTATELRKGPRGGGRDLGKIAGHVFVAELSYLAQVGGSAVVAEGDYRGVREAFLDALARRAAGELPETGPRGGRRWPAPYAARRAAWHVLDHVWEIEDRAG